MNAVCEFSAHWIMRNVWKNKIARVKDRKYNLNFKTEAKHLIRSRAVLTADFNVLYKPGFRHPSSRVCSSNITSKRERERERESWIIYAFWLVLNYSLLEERRINDLTSNNNFLFFHQSDFFFFSLYGLIFLPWVQLWVSFFRFLLKRLETLCFWHNCWSFFSTVLGKLAN